MKSNARRKSAHVAGEDLRPEYRFDYRRSKPNRFATRLGRNTVVVVLDPDVASVFDDSESVNSLLRSVVKAIRPKKVKQTARSNKRRDNE